MRNRAFLSSAFIVVTPILGTGLFAQDAPMVELFGGYSYFLLAQESDSGLTAANLNGWDASVKLNVRPRVGIVADFSGNYGERRMTPTQFQTRKTKPGGFRQHTILFGPEIRAFTNARLNVNVRALIGAAYVETLILPLREPFQPPPDLLGNPQPVVTEFRIGGGKPLTGALGGSVDFRISDRLYYRILQPEFVVINLGGVVNRLNLRVSTGIVFTFGAL